MSRYTHIVCFLVCLVSVRCNSPLSRIIGGEMVPITAYPYQASVLRFNRFQCGAAILSNRHLISAAHCFFDKYRYSSHYILSVRVGSNFSDAGGTLIPVGRVRSHPRYQRKSEDNDIAVLQLTSNLQFSADIKPVKLPEPNMLIPGGMMVDVAGWGQTHENITAPSKYLRRIHVPITDWRNCRNIYGKRLTENMICASTLRGTKDACSGDSGSAMVSKGILIGIVSWGIGCAQARYPGVYASVITALPFIKRELCT